MMVLIDAQLTGSTLLLPVNTKFAYINLGVKFQHMLVDIIQGELNITKFTIRHQWFVNTLAIWVPCCRVFF